MGFWKWMTRSSISRNNNARTARVKKEINFMSRNKKIELLKQMNEDKYYDQVLNYEHFRRSKFQTDVNLEHSQVSEEGKENG